MALAQKFFMLADSLEARKQFRVAEQLRGAVLSISNNIAEGSGSDSKRDFANFLNIARRSAFETANIIVLMSELKFIDKNDLESFLEEIEYLCRRITLFKKALF